MSFTISNPTAQSACVVDISETIAGQSFSGTGEVICNGAGGAEILTASHVLFQQGLGVATDIKITPAGKAGLGTYTAASIHYNAINDAHDLIPLDQTQQDFALIHVSTAIDGVGSMGVAPGYTLGGPATSTGFPVAAFGLEETASGVTAPVQGLDVFSVPFLGSGASGGPVWIPSGTTGAVVGVISSADASGAQFACELTNADISQLQQWMAQDGITTQLTNTGKTMVTTDASGAAVAALYEGVMGRAPDPLGLVYYHAQVDAGTSLSTVAQAMLASPEFQAVHGGETEAQFVGGLYDRMLGRYGSQAEISWYVAEIDHGISRAQIAGQFAAAPETLHVMQQWLTVL